MVDIVGVAKRTLKLVVGSAVLTALFSCSSEPVNPPAELKDFQPKVYIKRIWKESVGVGGQELDLNLQLVETDKALISVDSIGRIELTEPSSGKLLSKRLLNEKVLGGLSQDRDYLYYTNFQGELVCLEKETLNQRWRRKLSGESVAPPSSDGRTVVVQTISGSVHAFDVAEGVQLWRYDSVGPVLSLRGTAQPQISGDGRLLTSFANGSLVSFDLRGGQVQWKRQLSKPEGRTELERLVDADGNPVIQGNIVYAAGYQGNASAFDVRTGSEIWARRASTYRGLAVDESYVYVTLEDGTVKALNKRNSAEVWSNKDLSFRRLGDPIVSDGLLFVSDFDGYVHVLSTRNGELIARLRPDSEGVMGLPLVDKHHVYVYTNDGYIVAYHIYR